MRMTQGLQVGPPGSIDKTLRHNKMAACGQRWPQCLDHSPPAGSFSALGATDKARARAIRPLGLLALLWANLKKFTPPQPFLQGLQEAKDEMTQRKKWKQRLFLATEQYLIMPGHPPSFRACHWALLITMPSVPKAMAVVPKAMPRWIPLRFSLYCPEFTGSPAIKVDRQ